MRRFPAIVLLLVAFSLSLLTPLLLAGAEKPDLPACCRRDGNHHCAKQMGTPAGEGVRISAVSVCPLFPAGNGVPAAAQLGGAPPALTEIGAVLIAADSPLVAAEAKPAPSPSRPWQQRGPPSPLF